MKTIDKYLFKQILTATIVGVLLFIVVWISPEILFKIIRKTIYGEISFDIAIKLLFLEVPEILGKAIPVGLMIGSLWVFDQLSRDSELTIMRGIGISLKRLLLPVVLLSVVGVILSFLIYKDFIPYSTSTIKKLKNDVYQSHFVFIDRENNVKPRQILIVGGYTGTTLYDIKLLQFSDEENTDAPLMKSIITAQNAVIHQDHWELVNGISYKISNNGVYEKTDKFSSIDIFDKYTAEVAEKMLVFSTKRPREMSNKDIKVYINLLKSLDLQEEYRFTLSKYYQRYAHSIGCIFLGICGVLLGISRPREKRFLGFTMGVALIFLYYIILPFVDMLAQTGVLSPLVAAWVPNSIILTAIIGLVKFKNL